MSEQYVVIVDRSAGNESVGEMWQETKVFGPDATLQEAVDWAQLPTRYSGGIDRYPTTCRITLTRAHPAPPEEQE